ncbi:hypothetical protein [Ruminococcus sp. 5_1_39BFAA]|uniref:hypothetical protein n=1 Tax=Ruminococcus sp. 5_1_39BFAA TaxID=457412 RepID=UPI00356899BA
MNKKLKWILGAVNLLLLLALIISVIIPIERKTSLYMNVDVSDFSGQNQIPRVGVISNDRSANLKFCLYNEKLYGVSLYFSVDGEEDEGEILCTIKQNDETVLEETISVKALSILSKGSSLNPAVFVVGNSKKENGEFTISLQGNGISPKTRVSLLGNQSTGNYLKYVDYEKYGKYYAVLYSIETLVPKHPYIWACTLVLILSLLSSYIIYINCNKEIKVEAVK